MRTPLATVIGAALFAAAAPEGNQFGRDQLRGVTSEGETLLVDETWRIDDNHLRLVRRTRGGESRSCLEVEMDLAQAEDIVVSYRRNHGGSPIAVDLAGDRMRIQIGEVSEEVPVMDSPVPSSVLRFLGPGLVHHRPVLLESFGLITRADVRDYRDPRNENRVLIWHTDAIHERLEVDNAGRLLRVDAGGLRLERTPTRLQKDPLKGCGPPPRTTARRFDELPELNLAHIQSPQALQDWVRETITYREEELIPTAARVVERGQADCVGMALLSGAAARELGWRARQVLGWVEGEKTNVWHQWAEVYFDGRWTTVDAAEPLARRHALRRFAPRPRTMLANELLVLRDPSQGP